MKTIALIVSGFGLMFLFSGGHASAQNFINETGTQTRGSTAFGFDPSNLIDAVTGANGSGTCFICPNTTSEAGGTTAGALTNSMFGEIRSNNDADLGKQSTRPEDQGMIIPRAPGNCGNNDCNDASAFTFSLPLPVMNFLNTGATVSPTNPVVTETVGRSGVKMEFSNNFEYFADGTSTFAQTMKQTTFTGGIDFSNAPGTGNEVQIVEFEAHSTNPANPRIGGSGGTIFWSQSIKEGGFDLVTDGSFDYNAGNFPVGSAPTGAGQSTGEADQEIGGGGGR